MKKLLAVLLLLASSFALAKVTPIPGASDQQSTAGQPFANPIGVRVTSDSGDPMPNLYVTFSSMSVQGGGLTGSGGFYQYSVRSDTNGVAMLGSGVTAATAGTHTIGASVGDLGSTIIRLVASQRAITSTMSEVSANSQVTVAGTPLPQRSSVRLTRLDGTPMAQALVSFSTDPAEPTGSFGGLNFVQVLTDANGVATAPEFTTTLQVGRGLVIANYREIEGGPSAEMRMLFTTTAPTRGPTSYQDMWWGGPAETGWGMSLVQHGTKVFAVLFVYDAVGKPTWYVMPNPTWFQGYGRILLGDVYQPKGSIWSNYDQSLFEPGTSKGYARINFLSGNSAKLFLSGSHFDALGEPPDQGKLITRQDFTSDPAAPLRGVSDMWWGGLSQNGWGIAVLEQPGELFAVWFTYDSEGKPTWFVMPGGTWNGSEFGGDIYNTRGSMWRERPYDASQLLVNDVGQYRFRFDGNNASFDYTINGRGATLPLTRQIF